VQPLLLLLPAPTRRRRLALAARSCRSSAEPYASSRAASKCLDSHAVGSVGGCGCFCRQLRFLVVEFTQCSQKGAVRRAEEAKETEQILIPDVWSKGGFTFLPGGGCGLRGFASVIKALGG